MRLRVILLVCVSSTVALAAAQAKETIVEAASTIDSVIVHPDAATVTREATIDLVAGASTILLKNLPFSLDPDSLRVSGEANGRVTIGAVETRLAPDETRAPDSAIEAKLKQLRGAREGLQVTLDALAAKQAMIARYSQAGPEKIAPEARPLAIGEWNAAFDAIGSALTKTGEELRNARAKAKELDDEIHALEVGAGGRATRRPAREAAIAVESASGGKLRLTIAYLVSNAFWRPAYDARLDTSGKDGKPRLDLVRRATVTQNTGEDWSDVALTVSTTRAHRGAAAPDVQPQRVSFYEPPVVYARKAAAPAAALERGVATRRPAESATLAAPIAPAPEPAPVEQQTATLESDAFQASFKIPGRVGAPGDGATKSFILSSRRMEPTLVARVAPALDPTAFLEARIVNEEDAPLLPGPVAVQRDGVHVGQSRIAFVAPGEAVELGFGADDRIKVARAPVKRVENEPSWFGQTKYETRDFKTTIQNLHDFAIPVTAIDQIPFSENTAITIETLPQTTPPTTKQLADKRGVMAWSFDAKPGETKELRLAYRVKWPAEREIVTQPAPIAQR
ncbi:mucoidy inhibitor MuiA family protein [Methylosinus sp. H3A]|uniref:mucoidy inhibitor MuiA family protein n=1 Tax=Methylosinus sp. H3A TaxID=2785786 RepID=UPI0018C2BE7E|nr:mucoidy inhibitor MuiA family protein [Methylosinus sp. H3A]MBG0810152.1 mucoidy inhibitor MuiA family protein [Methylosinus sp. H3A]